MNFVVFVYNVDYDGVHHRMAVIEYRACVSSQPAHGCPVWVRSNKLVELCTKYSTPRDHREFMRVTPTPTLCDELGKGMFQSGCLYDDLTDCCI